ncbi:MAG: NADH-quinone oxidoreductase subunit L [Acidilobaceae archaeon]|nr:NADH-quinone oxidoreductase subunit L [Acidilobaceae archaeon]MCX8165795.1 NADH-quinone oxidoreductase subunit L [Acidilobaceae archaeon]MDW7974220.1 NADH-quinone oxidoreductase subunit L [Sulfolobales archaeon]
MYEPLFPWIFAWLAPFVGAGIIALGMLFKVKDERFYGYLSVLSILASALISLQAASKVFSEGRPLYSGGDFLWIPWLNVTLGTYFDGLSSIMALVVSWVSLFIAIYSTKYMEGDWGYGRYFLFFTFFVGSMMLLVLADNLILLFIGWEGTGLASYALIGHWYTDEEEKGVGRPNRYALGFPMFFEPTHSGLRAILFTRVGDIALLVGAATIFLATGTFNLVEIAEKAPVWMADLNAKGILSLSLAILSLGMLAKSAQFPFHEWLVTAMTGPTPVSALIHAATMVKAGIYLFLRFVPILLSGALAAGIVGDLYPFFLFVAALGAVTAFALATMALVSDELKLILAYSTASQIGYMFLGAASVGLLAGALDAKMIAEGVIAGMSHLASHAVFKAALFLVAGWLIHVAHSRFIDQMGGYASFMRLTAVAFWLAGLSLIGLPPLSGFFSKELVIHTAFTASPVLGIIAIVTAALTAAYTVRAILRTMHLPPRASSHEEERHEAPPTMLVPYLLLALASLLLGLAWPYLAETYSEMALLTLALGKSYLPEVSLSGTALAVVALVLLSALAVFSAYYVLKVRFSELIVTAPWSTIYNFLFDRWYLNSILYWLFKNNGLRVANFASDVDEGVDFTYHSGLPSIGSLAANALRSLHRGATDYYMALYLASIVALVLLIIALMG